MIKLTDIAILAIFLTITVVISVFLIKIFMSDRFVPGTTVGGIDVSGKTATSASDILEEAIAEYSAIPLKFKLDGTIKEIELKDSEIKIMSEETIQKALVLNKPRQTIFAYILPAKEKVETPFIISIDEKNLTNKLSKEFSLDPLKAQNAWYTFDNQGRLQISDGKNGLEIDENALEETIKTGMKNLESHTITIRMINTTPSITKESLAAQKDGIIQKLRQKLTLTHPEYRNRWTLSIIEHLDWVKFSVKQKNILKPETYMAIELDQSKLDEFIDQKMGKYLDVPLENVKIYTDKDGKIIIEGRGDNGKQIQRTLFKKAIELALENDIDTVPIPVTEISPSITVSEDLQALGIKERISIGHTTFYGSPLNRMYNIDVGARKLNATLINPDEIFSFNKTIGDVDGSTGYLMELVIKPEGTIPEFGGGLCQVSTTTYRAALFAGLPIEERYQHSYAVTYYSQVLGHGLDATVYIGGPDLKFKNDTGKAMLIQAYVKNKYELYVVTYGTADGRKVDMEGPYISNKTNPAEVVYKEVTDLPVGVQKKIEQAHVGFNALWYRYVTMPNGEKKKEEIISKYQTMPAKVLVGTEAKKP